MLRLFSLNMSYCWQLFWLPIDICSTNAERIRRYVHKVTRGSHDNVASVGCLVAVGIKCRISTKGNFIQTLAASLIKPAPVDKVWTWAVCFDWPPLQHNANTSLNSSTPITQVAIWALYSWFGRGLFFFGGWWRCCCFWVVVCFIRKIQAWARSSLKRRWRCPDTECRWQLDATQSKQQDWQK